MTALPRPQSAEHDPYYTRYIERAASHGGDVLTVLSAQRATITALGTLPPATARHAYADGKWTVTEVVGHLADLERIFLYRALRFARNDQTPVEGFDENTYVPAGAFALRPIADVAHELQTAREAFLAFLRPLDEETGARRGVANGAPCTVRALAWIVAGHFLHHLNVLHERYGVNV